MQTQITIKNVVMILVMITLVFFSVTYADWLQSHFPLLYPYHSVVFGIAIGIGLAFNAVPGQPDEPSSRRSKVISFFGAVAFTFLFFGVADWIKANHSSWFVPFRIFVLVLIFFGWRLAAKGR